MVRGGWEPACVQWGATGRGLCVCVCVSGKRRVWGDQNGSKDSACEMCVCAKYRDRDPETVVGESPVSLDSVD